MSEPQSTTEMTETDVLSFVELCEQNGFNVWIDGGWGVDALLGKQTRVHADLDIAIEQKYIDILEAVLGKQGYKRIKRKDERPHNFVLGDKANHQIDVHVVVLDEVGNGIYGPPENGEKFPASSLKGQGKIGWKAVKCIAGKDMIEFHTQYEPDEDDYHDVKLLCEKFNIPLPKIYKKFEPKSQPNDR